MYTYTIAWYCMVLCVAENVQIHFKIRVTFSALWTTLPSLGHVCNCRKPDQLAVSNCQVWLHCRVLRTALHALVMRSTRTADCGFLSTFFRSRNNSSAATQLFRNLRSSSCAAAKSNSFNTWVECSLTCASFCVSHGVSASSIKPCTFSDPEQNCLLFKKIYNVINITNKYK